MSRLAVGELIGADHALGTAFAVDRRTLITCWHCLTDHRGEPVGGPFSVRLGTDIVLSVAYVDHDVRLDMALLSLDPAHELPDGWQPLPLGSPADAKKDTRVEALGWAFRNPSTTEPQTMPAEIAVERTSVHDGEPVVQLFSPQVAAGLRPNGFSGGPVLARTLASAVVVGVVRWMQPDDADPTRAVGGTVYASPIQDIVSRWPGLAPARPPLEILAGDPGSPGRTLVADFLDTQLNGPGGRLPFAGRGLELLALDAWLADPAASPYHLVTGGAGTGKSTLLTRWAESLAQRAYSAADPATRIVFFPVSLRYDSAGVGPVVRALLHRVARVHNAPYDPRADADTLRDTLSELLTRPAPDGKTLLVLVDGLDEGDGWKVPNALRLPNRPGERVRIVLTARRTRQLSSAQAWFEALGLDTGNTSTVLTALDEDAVAALLHQALPGRDGATADALEAAAPHLWRLTRGDPVTTALYLQDLRLWSDQDQDLDRWIARVRQARPGLEGFMERWWREQSRLWSGTPLDDARCLYSLLALARGPLSEGELRLVAGRALDAKVSGDRVRSALETLDRFTLPGPEHATVALAHPLLAELRVRQLRDSDELDLYRQAFTDWGRQTLGDLWDGSLAPARVPGYLARHLVQHLVPDPESGTEPDAADAPEYFTDALRLVDPRWRRVREELDDDIDGYRRDVGRVAAAARRANRSAFEAGLPLPRLPEQVMCAAFRAGERTALSEEMTPALAAQLVRHGLWRRGRAMSYLASLEALRSYGCVMGIAQLAPLAEREDLPELRRLLVRLDHRYPEELAEATAGYTRRLLELGRPLEAVSEADWLAERPARHPDTLRKGRIPSQHEQRAFVRVWTLGELIPDLPDELARRALSAALREVVEDRDTAYAACHLTKHVTRRRAEELWPPAPYEDLPDWFTARFSEAELVTCADESTGTYGPAEVLITALDGGAAPRSHPFLRGDGYVDSCGYVAGARWLGERIRGEILYVALATGDTRGISFDVARNISVALNYDGLMSVVPERYAAWAAEQIADRMTDGGRTRALTQLLPVLEGEARQTWAEEVFAHAHHFAGSGGRTWDIAHVYAPACAAAGYTDRVLDLVESGTFAADAGWLEGLAPGLTLPQTERALALTTPDPDHREPYPPRRHVLPRLASFGPDQASRALALVYDQAEPKGMAGEVRGLLERLLSAGHQVTGRSSYGEVWWEKSRLVGPGIVPVYESGVRRCPVRPLVRAETLMSGEPVRTPQDLVDFAYGCAYAMAHGGALGIDADLLESEASSLPDLAGDVSDPWARLTLLAAGTHLPSGAGRDRVLTEILAILTDLRRETLTSEVSPRDEGFPAQCPWLVRGTGSWAPFFVRLLAPRDRPAVKELLFDGGFLTGVERVHYGLWGDEKDKHHRLDDWAYRLQPLTPLLDRDELDAVAALTEQIRSTTTRVSLRAALASCYAALGEYDQAFDLCRHLGWQNNDFQHHAMADVAVVVPAELIPRWVSEVHRTCRDGKERGPLWEVVADRWPELDREAMWRMFDEWTSDVAHDSADGVYADVLFYRHAMVGLGGAEEPQRLLRLIDRTTPGADRSREVADN